MRDEKQTAGHKPYSPPTLSVYGDVARLTASGTGSASENPGNADVAKKP